MTEFLEGPNGRLAYMQTPGQGPGVVFLGGFRSDMGGTKAVWLEDWAKARERAFLRFDYSGHGASQGAFEAGCIGDWLADARAALDLMPGPVVLVGSSMGGWISLLLARAVPERVAGLVTIAAAPDFTERGFWPEFSEAQRDRLMREGQVLRPSDYGDPYVITRRLIEDGRAHLVLSQPLSLPFPTRFLQGTADADVPVGWAMDLLDHAEGPDLRLTLVKGADHRFSTPDCLGLIGTAVEEVLARV
ncbi:alpha/beta hydrolase [Paracoccus shanxieyensis]|uniref:Palmitoyl-protein thioesterase ABHD10, mitochondrial n=1 Tax=Paracoccus shanxieyensis TaxID=2675752 RepID=A0A6L6J414_9RHOB|nr:alpha/beta hydrolase [Paracoccus shanxieyensis]MTH65464.1 alpha/beta fold hydrolase [Paracoccus shanxieyensis]MTH88609.1 alpha/beta fold hydrolase [Paracoccus shanxieyensis]